VKTLEKKWQKTINIEETLEPEKHEHTVHVCHNVRFAHSSTHTIHDNSDRIKERQKLQCLCSKTTIVFELTIPKTMAVDLLYCYRIRNKYIVQK
jgi:hypothetical protein